MFLKSTGVTADKIKAYAAAKHAVQLYVSVPYTQRDRDNHVEKSAIQLIGYAKTGEAKATSILGIIATGDASVAAAAKNGGITKVKTVDVKATSIIGIYATYTVVVTGE